MGDRAALCSRGLHALCSPCFQAYARQQQQQEWVKHKRGARLLCPCRLPHDAECIGSFSEKSMAAFLPEELYQIYMDQQRDKIHVEEAAKFNDMLNRMAKQLQKDMPGISRELLERQLKAALPGARQCGSCGYGPVEHYACGDLQSHHNESTGKAKINNACPKCGWFSADISQWPKWNGIVHSSMVAQTPSVDCSTQKARKRIINRPLVASSNDDAVARELQAREDARLAQVNADHTLAQRLSRNFNGGIY